MRTLQLILVAGVGGNTGDDSSNISADSSKLNFVKVNLLHQGYFSSEKFTKISTFGVCV
jgi:hypothetical protein